MYRVLIRVLHGKRISIRAELNGDRTRNSLTRNNISVTATANIRLYIQLCSNSVRVTESNWLNGETSYSNLPLPISEFFIWSSRVTENSVTLTELFFRIWSWSGEFVNLSLRILRKFLMCMYQKKQKAFSWHLLHFFARVNVCIFSIF